MVAKDTEGGYLLSAEQETLTTCREALIDPEVTCTSLELGIALETNATTLDQLQQRCISVAWTAVPCTSEKDRSVRQSLAIVAMDPTSAVNRNLSLDCTH